MDNKSQTTTTSSKRKKKVSRTTKANTNLKKEFERRAKLEGNARRIVEYLAENTVSDDYLLSNGNSISSRHYGDIVEERSITKFCGYPICNKEMGKMLRQQYSISTKSNKVYDITDRKKFCSNECYKASRHFQEQLSSQALWLQEQSKRSSFNLLRRDNDGLVGDFVVDLKLTPRYQVAEEVRLLERFDRLSVRDDNKRGPNQQAEDLLPKTTMQDSPDDQIYKQNANILEVSRNNQCDENINDDDSSNSSIDELEPKNIIDKISDLEISNTLEVKNASEFVADDSERNCDDPFAIQGSALVSNDKKVVAGEQESNSSLNSKTGVAASAVKQEQRNAQFKKDFKARVLENIKRASTQDEFKSPISASAEVDARKGTVTAAISTFQYVKVRLFEWKTYQTSALMRVNNCKNISPDETDFQKKYMELCRKVDAGFYDLDEEEQISRDHSGGSVPSMTKLLSEKCVTQLEIKERSQNNDNDVITSLPNNVGTRAHGCKTLLLKGASNVDATTSDEGDNTGSILPLVDSHSQVSIRRKIVLDKLMGAVQNHFAVLQLTVTDVLPEIRSFIDSFDLTSKNVLLKPGEWSAMAMLLLRTLILKSPIIQSAFECQKAQEYYEKWLGTVGASESDLNEVIQGIAEDTRESEVQLQDEFEILD